MPLKPPPTMHTCPVCGWKMIFAPCSDTLIKLPPENCARCGNRGLTSRPANIIEQLLKSVDAPFKKH